MNYLHQILFFIIFLNPLFSLGRSISENEAKDLAIKVLTLSKKSRDFTISLDMIDVGLNNRSHSFDNPPFYVFNNSIGQGFVIVSGDDAIVPILGYSINNNFPKCSIPESVMEWFESLSRQIAYIHKNRISLSNDVRMAWRDVAVEGVPKPILQLQTAQWDQRRPFNDDCFKINGSNSLTGCVATATAIVMRYHSWPDRGEGILPTYEFDNYVVPSRTLSSYDWKNMPLVYSNSATEEQNNAVAQLMADCGVMLKSIYGLNGTEAYTADVPLGIGKFMKYDKGARFMLRNDFSDLEWHKLLQKNLRECGPIIYKGVGASGGHSFIIDGYCSDNFYSVNWGWGGMYNGYYLLDIMEPGANIALNDQQGAVIGIRKDIGGSFKEEISFKNRKTVNNVGLSSSTDLFVEGAPFDLKINGVTNTGSIIFESLDFLLALTDKDGNIKQIFDQWEVLNLRSQYAMDEYKGTFTINSDILSGDRIRLFYRSLNSNWTVVKSFQGQENSWELIIKDQEEILDPIGKCVSLQFDKITNFLQLKVFEGIEVTVSNLKGEDFTEFLTLNKDVYNIDMNQLNLDTYIVRFKRGKNYKDIQIIAGTRKVSP